jgi:hypothetical protein
MVRVGLMGLMRILACSNKSLQRMLRGVGALFSVRLPADLVRVMVQAAVRGVQVLRWAPSAYPFPVMTSLALRRGLACGLWVCVLSDGCEVRG